MRKFTVEFDGDTPKQLDQLGKARKLSRVGVVRQALNVYSFLENVLRTGGKIYVESANGEKRSFSID